MSVLAPSSAGRACAFALLACLLALPSAAAQCPPPALPLSHGPITGLDAHTLVLGQFEGTNAMLDAAGVNAVKTTLAGTPLGLFGSNAATMPTDAAVGIYKTGAINLNAGTFELWFKAGPDNPQRQYLFSLQGTKSLDGDGFNDLIVGDPLFSGSSSLSRIYFDSGTGLDFTKPARFRSSVPRGVEVGDVDGDDYLDLIVAMNQGKTLSNPKTPTPGEVQIFKGPFQKGITYQSSLALEVDEPQGLVVADFDKDGDLDIIAASYTQETPAVVGYANDGKGSFSLMSFPYADIIAGAEVIAASDVNGDGVLDILYGSFGFPNSKVLIGKIGPNGYSVDSVVLTSSDRSNQVLGASFGDVNGDGSPDAVLSQPLFDNGPADYAGRLAIHLNNGDGTFEGLPDGIVETPRPFTVSAVKDVDNDGHLDVAVANWRQGPLYLPTSTVFLGPLSPVGGSQPLTPPSLVYKVESAVAMTLGDMNGDGISDLFFRSSTSPQSALFYLDANGRSLAGTNTEGQQLPSVLVNTVPTKDNPYGEGAGCFAALVGGTTTYGTVHDLSNTFELYLEGGLLHFVVTDNSNLRHEVTAPVPGVSDPDAVDGFHHVQAEWAPMAGLIQLRVGNAGKPANVFTNQGPSFRASSVSPVFRLGSDVDNQRRAKGFSFDDVRLSDVRRSQLDADADGVPDDWDTCPQAANPDQADADDNGIGDLCSECQPELGFQGPGRVHLTVCGQALSSCQFATLHLSGMPPQAFLLLQASVVLNPLPFKGGTLVTIPGFWQAVGFADDQGKLKFDIPGGLGPAIIYMQARVADAAQPYGAAISNAVELHFLP